jgi:hypothetical protein
MNENLKIKAEKLIAIELLLNKVKYKDCPVGSLLSYHIGEIYNNEKFKDNFISTTLLFFRYILKGLFISKGKNNNKKDLLLSKVGDLPHCNTLIDPLKVIYNNNSLLYTKGLGNEINPYNFSHRFKLFEFYLIISFIFKNFSKIKLLFNKNGFIINNYRLIYHLFVKLNEFENWNSFYLSNEIKVVLVDFDKNSRNIALVLAANKMKIKTITLVHGVINPPYGYWPILANEIWCWGDFQRKQLLEYGVNKHSINIVGNPISLKLNKKLRTYNSHSKINIGIGLNNIPDEVNKKFIDHLLKSDESTSFNWIIKLHPSVKKSVWMESYECENVKFYDINEINHNEFFSKINLLIIGNSGIGFEAIVNDIPLWIYRINEGGFGHDFVMTKHANCPDITNQSNLKIEFNSLMKDNDYLEKLLNLEKIFVFKEFYFDIGKDAINNIVNLLEKKYLK